MRSALIVGLLATALVVTGCSSSKDGAQAGGQTALASAGSTSVDPSSIEYFRVSVGDTVFFNTDQTDLTGQAKSVLDRQAAWLMQNPSIRVRIEGHADERGTREYNLALGARRANAVQSYLMSKGVDRGRLEAVTYGRERPIETCAQEGCWAQNRRARTAPL